MTPSRDTTHHHAPHQRVRHSTHGGAGAVVLRVVPLFLMEVPFSSVCLCVPLCASVCLCVPLCPHRKTPPLHEERKNKGEGTVSPEAASAKVHKNNGQQGSKERFPALVERGKGVRLAPCENKMWITRLCCVCWRRDLDVRVVHVTAHRVGPLAPPNCMGVCLVVPKIHAFPRAWFRWKLRFRLPNEFSTRLATTTTTGSFTCRCMRTGVLCTNMQGWRSTSNVEQRKTHFKFFERKRRAHAPQATPLPFQMPTNRWNTWCSLHCSRWQLAQPSARWAKGHWFTSHTPTTPLNAHTTTTQCTLCGARRAETMGANESEQETTQQREEQTNRREWNKSIGMGACLCCPLCAMHWLFVHKRVWMWRTGGGRSSSLHFRFVECA